MSPITLSLVFLLVLAGVGAAEWANPYLALPFFAVAAIVAMSLRMANAWQKFVILRMGKLQSVKGAGMFAIIPVVDSATDASRRRPSTPSKRSPRTRSR